MTGLAVAAGIVAFVALMSLQGPGDRKTPISIAIIAVLLGGTAAASSLLG